MVILLPRVREDVRAQGARIGESPCTILALKGFLPRVRAHVATQGARVSEPLSTRLALKRFLPRVRAHVVTQVARLRKPFSTRLALKRFLPCVRAHVPTQFAWRFACDAALGIRANIGCCCTCDDVVFNMTCRPSRSGPTT